MSLYMHRSAGEDEDSDCYHWLFLGIGVETELSLLPLICTVIQFFFLNEEHMLIFNTRILNEVGRKHTSI